MMITRAEKLPKPEPGPQEDPWFYGWRYVDQIDLDGKITTNQVPLTREDVLHPQEDDFIVQNDDHTRDCHYLKTVLDAHLADRPGVHVFFDHRMDWGVAEIEPHGPDFAIVEGFPEDWDGQRGTFCLKEFRARVLAVIEVTSPTTRDTDLDEKVGEYYHAGVPFYAIVDRQFRKGKSLRLLAYRSTPQGYLRLEPDAQGWLALETIGLSLRFEEGRLVCRDAEDRRLLDYREVMEEAQQAQQRAQAEAHARQQAEQRAQAEAQARQAETQAREQAEDQIRQLKAELNRLRGQS